jgi:hypothetical protein
MIAILFGDIHNVSITLALHCIHTNIFTCIKLFTMKRLVYLRYITWIAAISIAMTLAGTYLLGRTNNESFVIFGNGFFWNSILINITFMGDAFFAFGVVFLLLFFLNKKNLSSRLLLMLFCTLLITQAIKNIFSGLPFQLLFESGNKEVGESLVLYKNIISSHVAIAFTMAIFFALYSKNLVFKISVFVISFVVAYSRMKLMGESIAVVLLGLVPAVISTLFVYKLVRSKAIGYSFYYRIKKEKTILGQQIMQH